MADYLVVALGNPGEEYALTRHNIGWLVCDNLRTSVKAPALKQGRGPWFETSFSFAGSSVTIIFPTTYMNRSGVATVEAAKFYKVPSRRIIAVVDEYNFPVGKIHLKIGGTDGGHNGIASLEQSLQTQDFYRLRCGIDKNFGKGELVRYVLSPFEELEQEHVQSMIQLAVKALQAVFKSSPEKAQQSINSGKL